VQEGNISPKAFLNSLRNGFQIVPLKLSRKSNDSQKSAKFEAQHSFFRILMEVLSKEMIRQLILPALTFSTHGRPSAVEPVERVEGILHKLKSGSQWRLLPVK